MNNEVKRRYDRYALVYDLVTGPMELLMLSRWRKSTFRGVAGKVLEVGIGTGKSLKYYPAGCEVTGIDLSEKMLAKARRRAENMKNVKLLLMDAEKLEFPDNSFDFVVTNLVLCSVQNPVAALMEMKRVCKKEGRIIMLEHVKSKNRALGAVLEFLNPLPSKLFGVNINRNTVENAKKAGLTITVERNLAFLDVFKLIEAEK